jgi:hypothetical protein
MIKKKIKTFVLNIGGKKKKVKVDDSNLNVYVALLSQQYLS